jgi:hypothetical protein
MIRQTSFKHGWFYHYRIHLKKTDDLCSNGLSSLKGFMHDMFEKCPHDKFETGPRSSSLRFNLDIKPVLVKNHEVSELAKKGLEWNKYKTAHSNVQVFMLHNDQQTLAVELPIWLKSNEINNYNEFFDSELPLTGHIDALRVEDGKIWIWDYKPKANKEKYATTQTFFYALMLSRRTGIDLDNFRCGYFDENNAYIFKPELKQLIDPQKRLT